MRAPPEMAESLRESEGGVWADSSAAFQEATNLTEKDSLDEVFICVSGSGPRAATFSRPVP